MSRRVHFSFHYDNDAARVQQVTQMGVLEGRRLLTAQHWEEVADGGDPAIRRWIADELAGKSCLVVLIGRATAQPVRSGRGLPIETLKVITRVIDDPVAGAADVGVLDIGQSGYNDDGTCEFSSVSVRKAGGR